MTSPDPELAAWMADWRADPAPADPEAIRRRVKRRSLGLVLLALGELVFSAGVLIFLIGFALRNPHPMDVATMTGLSLLTLWALGFAHWNRRGVWRPGAETTAAFLDLSVTRCRRRLRSLRAGWGLLAVETVLYIPWIWHRLHLDPASPSSLAAYLFGYGFLAAVCGVTAGALLGIARWTRRELAELERMQGERIPV